MTYKEKLDKLVAEIKWLIGDYNIKTEKYRGINEQAHQYYGGKRDALFGILKSIDTMQEEPKKCMYTKDHYKDEDRKVLCDGCGTECEFNKKEEPVSEELEEAGKEWLKPQLDKSYANYGEAKMMELTHFDGYAMLDAIEFGANWKEQQMMAKAVDVEVKVDAGGYPYIPQMELYDYGKDIPLAKEGDKYKVILIKED